jgi:ABC-type multidrug transport system fused ATPase/permease subunit
MRETSFFVLLVFLSLWGIIQVMMAFCYSAFFWRSTTAAAFGYGASLFIITIAMVIIFQLYLPPIEMPAYLHLYPSFTFTRVFVLLVVRCANQECYHEFGELSSEVVWGLVMMLLQALVLLVLGLYCHEVVPQAYGKHQHPFFLCRRKFWQYK